MKVPEDLKREIRAWFQVCLLAACLIVMSQCASHLYQIVVAVQRSLSAPAEAEGAVHVVVNGVGVAVTLRASQQAEETEDQLAARWVAAAKAMQKASDQ